ncbi:nucleotidyltransferase family protein [Flavisphingomonas formosensis]|uniref:nucleotidyltransferase family protein n=1 Tax=Flavisphingomonas formosensis TaxID=861534 RepID=UPI0012FC6185|nr:nucleotidyltransferase family protein [Sphingomonas formosensis]
MASYRDLASLGLPQPDLATRDLLRAVLEIAPPSEAALALAGRALAGQANRGIERLLPFAARSAWLAAADPPGSRRIAAVRRRAAMDMLAYQHFVQRVIGQISARGIAPLVTKGYALARLYYDDPAHRPAGDLDIAIRPGDWSAVLALLEAEGFRAIQPQIASAHSPAFHAHGMSRDSDPYEIDLHRSIVAATPWPGADDGFWARARPFAVGKASALTLSDADHLLHACLHGCMPNDVLPIRWIVDAGRIVAHGTPDWTVLIGEARRRRAAWPVAACLGYLRDEIGIAVPEDAIRQLADEPMEAADEAYFRIRATGLTSTALRDRLRFLWLLYRRSVTGRHGAVGFLRWLRTRWGIAGDRSMIAEAVRRLPRAHWRR